MATTRGSVAARCWLKGRAETDAVEVRPPSRPSGASEELQVVAMVPVRQWDAVMQASGQDGVFARPFHEDRAEFGYRVVPLMPETSLEAAARQGKFLGDKFMGVVLTQRGLGLRVRSEHFEDAV